MRGKALFFGVLVVAGAVLPYLLADPKISARFDKLLSQGAETETPSVGNGGAANEPKPTPRPSTGDGPIVAVESQFPLFNESALAPVGNLADSSGPQSFSADPQIITQQVEPQLVGPYATMPTSATIASPAAAASPKRKTGLVGPRGIPIEHLLSFEVTPRWISDNWSRVTTSLPELELKGWRVPIALEDAYELTGSVTYYFDRHHRVQRILLHGLTTNPRQLAQLATTRYRMQQIPNHVGEFYVHMNQGLPLGGLRVSNSSIRKANARSEVLMELNRQGTSYGISSEFEKLLRSFYERDETLDPIPDLSFESNELEQTGVRSRKPSVASDLEFQRKLQALQESVRGAGGNRSAGLGRLGLGTQIRTQSLNSQTPRFRESPPFEATRSYSAQSIQDAQRGNAIRPPFRRLPK